MKIRRFLCFVLSTGPLEESPGVSWDLLILLPRKKVLALSFAERIPN